MFCRDLPEPEIRIQIGGDNFVVAVGALCATDIETAEQFLAGVPEFFRG